MRKVIFPFIGAVLRFAIYLSVCFGASLLAAFLLYRAKSNGELSIGDDIITLVSAGVFCLVGIVFMLYEAKQKKRRDSNNVTQFKR